MIDDQSEDGAPQVSFPHALWLLMFGTLDMPAVEGPMTPTKFDVLTGFHQPVRSIAEAEQIVFAGLRSADLRAEAIRLTSPSAMPSGSAERLTAAQWSRLELWDAENRWRATGDEGTFDAIFIKKASLLDFYARMGVFPAQATPEVTPDPASTNDKNPPHRPATKRNAAHEALRKAFPAGIPASADPAPIRKEARDHHDLKHVSDKTLNRAIAEARNGRLKT